MNKFWLWTLFICTCINSLVIIGGIILALNDIQSINAGNIAGWIIFLAGSIWAIICSWKEIKSKHINTREDNK